MQTFPLAGWMRIALALAALSTLIVKKVWDLSSPLNVAIGVILALIYGLAAWQGEVRGYNWGNKAFVGSAFIWIASLVMMLLP
ncbi:hypothetical protein GTP23_20590 [Pseudoduganella sp. FT93W]|uniref:Uncharacterized protein n=1 Tax=Duganella fentianensis TaxID=2692177 RepID=A0A845I691_9BURK|nr:hypothetical protein [Duganella fentianensis]MYN47446.1 hypothetical protein [Duganella fentianensis]